jgi:hypothetical protein
MGCLVETAAVAGQVGLTQVVDQDDDHIPRHGRGAEAAR